MAGRGRGRGGYGGAHMNRNSFGILGEEFKQQTEPPPLYPPLNKVPIPLEESVITNYMYLLKEDFIDRLQTSGAYLKLPPQKDNDSQQEIDRLLSQLPSAKESFDWDLFPTELRPKNVPKKTKILPKQSDGPDVISALTKLQEQEEENSNHRSKKAKLENDETIIEDQEVEYEDEEIDDGTDYGNNYFDNGEGYDDDDDNLDEGDYY